MLTTSFRNKTSTGAAGAGAGAGNGSTLGAFTNTPGTLSGVVQLNFVPAKNAPRAGVTAIKDDKYRRYIAVAFDLNEVPPRASDSPGEPVLQVRFGASIFRVSKCSRITYSPKNDFAKIARTAQARLAKRPACFQFTNAVTVSALASDNELVKELLRRVVHPSPNCWVVGGPKRLDKGLRQQRASLKEKIASAVVNATGAEAFTTALVTSSTAVAAFE